MSMLMFIVVLLLGLMFLSGALVVVLTGLLGSLILALLIVGVIYALIALTLYYSSIRRTLNLWHRRLDTVYDVSSIVEEIFRKMVLLLRKMGLSNFG